MKNKIEKKIIDKFDGKFITDKDLESVSLFEIKGKKKEKRNKNDGNSIKKQVNSDMRRGRKNKNDNIKGNHDKNAPDNIIKKCKRIFFKYIIIFINSIIKKYSSNLQKNHEFKKLNYKIYIDNLKKDKEYFSRFIFYLFHYKNWFLKKKPRKPRKPKKNEIINFV